MAGKDNDFEIGDDLDHVQLLYPSQYLSESDLKGRDATLCIERVTLRDLHLTSGGVERKPVIHFIYPDRRRDKKKLVMNVTNARTVAAIYGPKPSAWHGKRITLFPTTCQAFGKTVPCIRIRDRAPAERAPQREQAAEPLNGAFEDWRAAIDNATPDEAGGLRTVVAADSRLDDTQRDDLMVLIQKRKGSA